MSVYDTKSVSDDMRLTIEFVKEVEKHPCLYNVRHKYYSNKISSDDAWKQICQRFRGLTDAELKVKWRSVRSSFRRSLRTQKDYYLTPYLDYLMPYTKPIKHTYKEESFQGTMKKESDKSDDESCSQTSGDRLTIDDEEYDEYDEHNGKIQVTNLPELRHSNGMKFKRIKGSQSKILTQNQYAASRLSPHECFLKSIMPDISAMDERQFFNFRRGMLNIVGKIKYNESKKDSPETE